MATNGHTNGVTNDTSSTYSIPREARSLLDNGVLKNPLIAPNLPQEIEECAKPIKFKGNDAPSLAINWRFAESISALKGLEAAMVNVLLRRKYNLRESRIKSECEWAGHKYSVKRDPGDFGFPSNR